MKYIRTKDGIYTQERYKIVKSFVGVLQDNQARIMPIEKTDFSIIKTADTIDKLCDTFVICVDKQGYLIIDDYKKAMEIMQRNDDDNAICYGAIWCEWGLKYVAKMNKKVEMELL